VRHRRQQEPPLLQVQVLRPGPPSSLAPFADVDVRVLEEGLAVLVQLRVDGVAGGALDLVGAAEGRDGV